MKKRLTIGIVAGLIAFVGPILLAPMLIVSAFTGCANVPVVGPDGTTNVVIRLDPMAGGIMRGVGAIAVPPILQKDPNAGPYLRLAAQVFSAAAASGNYDPAAIKIALDKISIRELRQPEANQLVLALFSAYKGFFGDAVNTKLDVTKWGPWIKDVLQATADGINAGLPPG